MPTIKITDALQAELLTANPHVNSGFGKYLKGTPAALLAGADIASQFTKDLALANPGESGLSLRFSQPIDLGNGKPQLKVSAGARATIGIYNRTGMLLFDETFLGAPAKVRAGQAFVAFAFHPSLSLSGTAAAGELGFGFSAGTEAELRCYRPFDTTGAAIKVADACRQLFENYTIPGSAADLEAMRNLPDDSVATVSGAGTLSISASLDFAAALNPLASVGALPKVGKLTVTAGASVKTGVSVKVFGEFEIRVRKQPGNLLRLSYHKMHAGELGFSIEAAAGPGLSVGNRELLSMVFGGDTSIGGDAETALVAAGVTRKQLDAIRAALRAGMSKKLSIEFAAQFSSLRRHDAAFEYEIDLAALDDTGRRALDEALAGNLTGLNDLEEQGVAHGIRATQSLLQKMRKRTIRLRINLLGLLNVISLSEFVRTGTVFHDDESGELVISDEVSAKRIGAVTQRRNVRKVLYESAILTATYKAAGIDVNHTLEASQSFFFFDRKSNRQRVSDYLDAVAGAGLIDPADIDNMLAGIDDFGAASILLETTFDDAACRRMFLDGETPLTVGQYENIAKNALLALVAERDPDKYRRIPLLDAALWEKMKDAGQATIPSVLPPKISGGAAGGVQTAVVVHDYSLIVWWAETMADAAAKLAEMRRFLADRDPATLDADATFQKLRDGLASSLADSLRKNKASFDDPWGLLALFMASRGAAEISALVVSPKLTLSLPEQE